MAIKQIGILEADNFSKRALGMLREIGKVSLYSGGDIGGFTQDKDVLFIRLKYHICDRLIHNAVSLKYICSPTTGLNHIDLNLLKRRGIQVISLKGEEQFLSTIRATPEHIFGLTLSLLRNYKGVFDAMEQGPWDRDLYRGHELYGEKVGIIGFGRVGKILAKYFTAFNSQVYFYDNNSEIEPCFSAKKMSSLEELIEQANIVLLCASYEPSNEQFFNEKYIDLLEGKYFINAARGELLDETFLLKKIKQGAFKGIALDVISHETLECNNLTRFQELVAGRNFILTPHIGGATYESMWRTEDFISQKLIEKVREEY